MDKLDKLFKDKLDNRTFEFKESYWEAAEMLIDQDKKGRRRFAFWWWRIGLLLLAIGGVTYFVLASKNNVPTKEANSVQPNSEISNTNLNDPVNTAVLNSADQLNSAQSGNKDNSNTSLPVGPESEQDHNSNSYIRDSQSYENPAASDHTNKGASHLNRENIQAVPVPDSSNFNIPEIRPDTANKKPKLAIQDKTPSVKEPINPVVENRSIKELAQLETVTGEIDIPETDCADCFELITKKFKPKKWAFAAGMEGLYYPKANYPDGLTGGAFVSQVDFRLGKKWALSSGLNYMIADADVFDSNIARTASGGFDLALGTQFSPTTIYSFGSRTIENKPLPKRTHYLEIPLLVKYKMNNHALTAGVYTDILVGVRGGIETRTSLFPWEVDNTGPNEALDEITISNDRNWINKDAYQKYTLNLNLGYEVRVFDGLSVSAAGFYNLGDLNLNKSQDDQQGVFETYFSDKTLGLDRFHFRAGLKWYFKN